MTVNSRIRIATEHDSPAILGIYAPFIKNTPITFEYKVPSENEFSQRMKRLQEQYPWLVYEIDQKIVGYAYADKHHEREAYKWSVHYSVYIDPEYQGKGIGTQLYTAMTEILRIQGYYNAYAIITSPNMQSERFHELFGFKPIGFFKHTGYKLGSWHDVSWYELAIHEISNEPKEPKSITEVVNIEEIINRAVQPQRLV